MGEHSRAKYPTMVWVDSTNQPRHVHAVGRSPGLYRRCGCGNRCNQRKWLGYIGCGTYKSVWVLRISIRRASPVGFLGSHSQRPYSEMTTDFSGNACLDAVQVGFAIVEITLIPGFPIIVPFDEIHQVGGVTETFSMMSLLCSALEAWVWQAVGVEFMRHQAAMFYEFVRFAGLADFVA